VKAAGVRALPYVAPCLDSSDEIPFAQFNTAVPQDVVGRGAVEIKVGRHEMHQIGWPLKLIVCSPRVRVPDLTVNVVRLDGFHECHRISDPRLEMGIGLLSVVMFWHFHIREPRSGSLGEIGCNLDLANERKHIRGKPVIEQHWPEPIT